MTELPTEFLERMKAQLGAGYPAFLESYSLPATRGLRVNSLRFPSDGDARQAFETRYLPALGLSRLDPVSYCEYGYALSPDAPPLGEHPYNRAGLFYLQEPSAMSAAALLAPKPNMKVLDLCAAPGGKTGALAAYMRGRGLLVANEPVKNRAVTLVTNIERLGVTNAAVTVALPSTLEQLLPGYFDAVMVDAPCSGEGMFRKDENARAEWSREHVASCANRQREILRSAAALTAPNGRIVYSTCTFSMEEDEDNARWFISVFPRFTLKKELKLYPHMCEGEGHYAALFVSRNGEGGGENDALAPAKLAPVRDARFTEFMADTYETPPDADAFLLADGRVALMPFKLPAPLMKAYILRAGVLAGSLEKGRFEPAHALFMAAFEGARWQRELRLELSDSRLDAFLRGGEVEAENSLRGYAPVTADGLAVGFTKLVDGTAKNKLPKGLRRK